MAERHLLDKLKIQWVVSDDFKEIPVKGAIGNVLPDGTISASVYSERMTTPSFTSHTVDPDGRVDFADINVEDDGGSHITRTVLFTMVMSPVVAEQFGTWLLKQSQREMPEDESIDDIRTEALTND